MLVNRVEQYIIKKSHPMWKTIDTMCFNTKNFYNYANYILRQEYLKNKEYISYRKMNYDLKTHQPYKDCMSVGANYVLRNLDKNWKSYFRGLKEYERHPFKFLGKPKPPKYLKKDGRFNWCLSNTVCYFDKENGEVKFHMKILQGFKWKSKCQGRIIQVRFIPRKYVYVMEIVSQIEIPDTVETKSSRIVGIDLGVDNLAATSNNVGLPCFIINGRGIKSINRYFNKKRATTLSMVTKRNGLHWCKKLDMFTYKRFMKIKNYMHNASSYIIKWCVENQIDTIIVGHNDNWKQDPKMGRTTSQNFIFIPYEMLIGQLKYKAEDNGIKFIETEESYTSGTSFLDNELPVKENYRYERRIKRGIFQSDKGQLINSDINGSLQIIKKVFPDAFSYGIEGCPTPTIINAVTFTA